MKENVSTISTKLSDYIAYPFLIPNVNLDFKIYEKEVVVLSSFYVKPKLEEQTKLILKGIEIDLLSISIDGKELGPETKLSSLPVLVCC